MGSVYVLVMIAALSLHCSAYVVSHSETDRSTASVLLKEEQSAEISCMTKGTGDYFWRKGETLYNSTLVAYFTVGEVSDDSQPYYVTVNGTLHIRSVTVKDEGNYFCRVSSAENECYGEVKILVQASLRNFDLAIDLCDGENNCLLYLNPSQFTSLTCTALSAPPLMTLKWFNGAKEITEGIEQNEILPQNGNSREITSTITAVYGHPASLTCQAVDPKRSNDDVRFAHAQVEMAVPVHESLATWIIVAGTLAGCFIVYVIFSLIKARANRTKYKTKKKEQANRLEAEKDKALSDLKNSMQAEKDKALSKLENSMQAEKDEALSKLENSMQAEKDEALSKLEKEKDDEISRLKLSAKAKDTEISKLKKEIAGNEEKMIAAEGDVRSKARSITELEKTVKQKDREINNQRNKFLDCQEEFTKLEELYKNLKGAQQRSQNNPRKKHQGNDGD